jgi:hypothetical protein
MDEVYGEEMTRNIQGVTEYVRHTDPCDDPFAEWHGVEPTGDCSLSQ